MESNSRFKVFAFIASMLILFFLVASFVEGSSVYASMENISGQY